MSVWIRDRRNANSERNCGRRVTLSGTAKLAILGVEPVAQTMTADGYAGPGGRVPVDPGAPEMQNRLPP
jgi:hypothetical protein